MSLYRQDATGFLGLFLKSPPGAGWTAVPAQPGAPVGAVTEWWRKLDQNVTEITDWHPSLAADQVPSPKPSGLAGSGANIFPARYSSWEDPEGLPPMFLSGVEVKLVATGFHGNWRLRITATEDNGYLYFASAEDDYNIKITPYRKWIISAYFSAPVAGTPFTWLTQRTDAFGNAVVLIEYNSAAGVVGGQWVRQHAPFNWLEYGSVRANMGIRLDKAGDVIDIDAIMLEELLGDDVTPSAYTDPPYVPKPNDPVIENAITATKSNGQGNTYDREILVGGAETFLAEQLPAIDVAKEEKRGKVFLTGVITLKKYNVNDGMNFRGFVTITRNGETEREIEFALPPLKFGHIPFCYSDMRKDPGELFYTVSVSNTGGSRFILQEVDWFWTEQIL